ncbi:MAG TPA: cyclopropane-fatty-acyl-phospholipid synthase family protein [Solirubrobacteraceae bacterium]|nr:cyclopropane-fatty-acyl-phospholipid synthase family protein [Solirubrobacteraceae bacterium]
MKVVSHSDSAISVRLPRAMAEAVLQRIHTGTLVILQDGERRTYGRGEPMAFVEVASERVWRALMRGSRGLADSYADGLWNSPDLVALIRLAARNATLGDAARTRLAPILRPLYSARALARPPSRRRRKTDIAAHYDLGEDLFERMLDPTMTYSCALFRNDEMTLEEAQLAKLDLVCDKLELSESDRVLEIGTGWGSFALHAASSRGCHVTTTTISRRQHAFALERVRRAGLEDRVTVLEADYRDLRGRFDKLVSIEMIEAVGWRHTGNFFAACSRLLEPHGAMLLQAITIDDRLYELEKGSHTFVKETIFPGGSLPSIEAIARDVARRTDLQMTHLEDITTSYVKTLRRWRERLLANAAALGELGYDERFRRVWALYLAYCEAGFAERRIRDVQLVLAKQRTRLEALGAGRILGSGEGHEPLLAGRTG